jgi:hypothetical protein
LNFTEKKKEKKEQKQERWQNHHHHHHLLLLLLLGGGNRFLLSLYLWLMQEVQTEGWFTFSQNPHTHPLRAIIKPKHPQTKKQNKKYSLSHPQSASSHQFHHHHHHHLLLLHHHHPIMAIYL